MRRAGLWLFAALAACSSTDDGVDAGASVAADTPAVDAPAPPVSCRPIDHARDPAKEPIRLPCARTEEACDGVDDDADGITDPHCGTMPCTSDADCTLGGLLLDSDCDHLNPKGPVCREIDGVRDAPTFQCAGVLCPPGRKCTEGECVLPGTGLPESPCTSGRDCPLHGGCIPIEDSNDSPHECVVFCQDLPCPAGYECGEYSEAGPSGVAVSHVTCNEEGEEDDPR